MITSHTTDFEVVSSHVEDGRELNIRVSTNLSPDAMSGDPEPRRTIITPP